MTTVPKRLAIKFNLKQNPSTQAKDIVPVFQRWIQDHSIEGMLIDVIDYKHVTDGPGVLLVADEGDYGYDFADGQVGLQYLRKRFLPDTLAETIRLVFRLAFKAAQQLETEGLAGVEFDYASAKISFLDRRLYRNNDEAFEQVKTELGAILSELYGQDVNLSQRYDDPRDVFAVGYQVDGVVDLDKLASGLEQEKSPI